MPNNDQINPHADYKYFNLNLLSEVTGIGRDKMYKNMKGSIKTLSDEQKVEIFDMLNKALDSLQEKILDGCSLEGLKEEIELKKEELKDQI